MVQTLDPSVGGVAPAVLSLSRGLAQRGHKVDIITLDDPGSLWLRNPNPALTGLTVHALGVGSTRYRYSKQLLPWLRAHGRNYDRVIVNGLWQYMSLAAWRYLHETSTPYFVYPHGMLDPWFKETFPFNHL